MINQDDIKDSPDVPKWYRPYLKYSMNMADDYRKERLQRMKDFTDQSLIDGVQDNIDTLDEKIKEGMFVDPALCNDAGVYINLVAYYDDRIVEISQVINDLQKMRKTYMSDVDGRKLIEKNIREKVKHRQNCERAQKREAHKVKEKLK